VIQIIRLLLILPALIAAWFVANDALSLGLIEAIVVVAPDRRLCRRSNRLDHSPGRLMSVKAGAFESV
jgi:hypothetical protein